MWKTDSPFISILVRLVGVVFNCDVYQSVGLFVLFCTVAAPASGQTSVLTQHNDNARTGQNTSETILNTANVNVNQFGKLFAMPADGQVYAQPLYVPGVTIKGGVHNVVILATENDSVYAYDADSSDAPLWKVSMVDAPHGAGANETALNSATTTGCPDTQPKVGITSTPVIDPTSKTIYVEAKSTDGTNYFHRLHALDLLTGNEKTPGPVVIAATVPGTGDGSLNGQLGFDNLRHLNRPGLLLLKGTNNSTIYIAYASHCDSSPYHGWLFAYDAATFTQKSVYVTTPNKGLGGFWMSGTGVAADASGNIFIASGNGDFDMTSNPVQTGDTILKLGTTNQILTLVDYFTPQNQFDLEANGHDLDVGSGGVLLLPDQPGQFPHILVEAGKEGKVYVVNRDQMTTGNSHYCNQCGSDPEIIEETATNTVGSIFDGPAYWNNTVYFLGVNHGLTSIPVTNGLPDFTHISAGSPFLDFPGAGISISSNGVTAGTGIAWAISAAAYNTPGPALLLAYDATNVLTVLYTSAQNATRDAAGNAVKFAVPTVANGKVYVGTSTEVDVYGLLGGNSLPQISSISPSSTTVGGPAFTLTVNGTNFVSGATVNFGTSPAITPSSVTSTQIVATIPAADIASAGTVNVTVTNPAGGGTSNPQTFAINNPAPTATSLSPVSATAGGAAFSLTVNGTGFVSTSVVKFNGAAKTTTFVSATQLTAAITAADIATAGTATVSVTNPAPGGGTSANLSFTINAASAPALTSLAPTSATAGGAAFTFTLTGTGFVAGATVNFGSNPAITPSSVTSTQIVVTIPAADIATAGMVNVTVTNPGGGGTSNAQTFAINNPAPTVTSLSPSSATAGGAAFSLTVNGTGFVSTSVVKFNGVAKTATFVSATQLTAAITAADIATAGTATVSVTNPAPGGGTSGNLSFTINAASAPALTSLAPTSATAGGAAFTFTLTGTGFVAGATVNFGSNPAITPSSVTSTQIVATIPAADIATAGTVNVTVTNPAGSGTSNPQTFAINNPAPTATSLSPVSATAGGVAFSLTVNGTGFVSTSVVKFNGAARTTTFVSATQLTAAITAADIATAGTATVSVTNPAPGGGTSANLSFTINAASAPALTSLAPTSATAGGAAFTFTLTGTGFVAGATVNFGSNPAITPSSVTSTQIVVTIPAADIATAGMVNVTVTNPGGGGTSNAQTFAINNPAPTVTSLSPSSATAGGAAFSLTVNGTGFVSTSVVKFNGVAKTATFVSATQLTAAITAADIATAGTATVSVTNPAPGGGTSGNLSFTINAASAPALTSLAPTSATAGGAAFTFTLTGTGFVAGATVNFGSNPAITPSSVTSTQIVATIPAADIATAGTVNVTVTNPAGSGTSNAQTFAINNPAPTVTSLSPMSATAGGAAFSLTVNGTGFVSTSVVKFNGVAKTTTFVSATQLTAAITAADIATAGTATVIVTNPVPGGGTSGNLSFTINAASAPTLTSFAPTSATAGGAAFTFTLTGTGFVAGATVNFGSNPAITPSSVTSTQIVVTIPAADIATAGTVNVTVTNPGGGGTSNAQTFAINNPAPTVTSLSPSSAMAGGAAFSLAVNGTGFVSTSVVKFNGVAKTTTFVSATQLAAAITATDIATAGTATVTVTNPAPSGTSNALSFTINNAVPTIGSLSPSSAVAGSAAFTLTVNGVGFLSGATVNFNGTPKATIFVSNTQITAAILASDIATTGTANITVTNPAPTLGPSGVQVFTISSSNSPAPTISSLGPTHASGGTAFTLTINGANFGAKSVVNFNGKPETTTFISATQISAAVPASDVSTAGNVNVTVTNPPPGGGTSPASIFTVDGYSLGGPSGASLTSGQPAMIQITATPTANGFTNSISFSVVGLPAGATASFNPAMLTLNGVAKPTMLTITNGSSAVARRSAGSGGSVRLLQPLLATWFVAILGWFYLRLQVRANWLMKRYTALALFALILLTGGILGGCALGVNGSPSVNTSQLTVTATSGTLTQTFTITLQVTANIGGR